MDINEFFALPSNERVLQLPKLVLDATALARVAIEDPDEVIRRAATRFISDHQTLRQILQNDPAFRVREEAIRNTSDSTMLYDAALSDTNKWVQLAAVDKLASEEYLAKLMMESENLSVQKHAVEKIHSYEIIANLEFLKLPAEVGLLLVRKVTMLPLEQMERLLQIFAKHESWIVKVKVAQVTTNSDLLQKLIKDEVIFVQQAAQKNSFLGR